MRDPEISGWCPRNVAVAVLVVAIACMSVALAHVCLGAIAATAGNSSAILESCVAHHAIPPLVEMPPLVHAMIYMRWAELDSEGERLMESLRALDPLHSFAHARDTFYEHLRGTWAMLATWGQPQDTCRAAGLFHTGYVRSASNA